MIAIYPIVPCRPGWVEYPGTGSCIQVNGVSRYWDGARATCRAAGADLVKIIDGKMNMFIAGETAVPSSLGLSIKYKILKGKNDEAT